MLKRIRRPVSKSTSSRSKHPIKTMFGDLSGPRSIKSAGVSRYRMPVEGDYSRFGWTYFPANKSEVVAAFHHFIADVRGSGTRSIVSCFRSDNARTFIGRAFKILRRERGIQQEITTDRKLRR